MCRISFQCHSSGLLYYKKLLYVLNAPDSGLKLLEVSSSGNKTLER